MKISFLLFTFLSIFSTLKAQSVITIQHNSTTVFATTLDSAIIKAQNGDYIYLPPGLVATISSPLNISKKVKILVRATTLILQQQRVLHKY